MAAHTKFFPSFHRHLFGRPPVSDTRFQERQARAADQLCLTQLHTLFENVLPPWLASYKCAKGANSRRIYSPLVTFWAFLSRSQNLPSPQACESMGQSCARSPGLQIPHREHMPLRLNQSKKDAMGQRQLDLLQRLRHAGWRL